MMIASQKVTDCRKTQLNHNAFSVTLYREIRMPGEKAQIKKILFEDAQTKQHEKSATHENKCSETLRRQRIAPAAYGT